MSRNRSKLFSTGFHRRGPLGRHRANRRSATAPRRCVAAGPERLEERRVLTAAIDTAVMLCDPAILDAYLAAGQMGPEFYISDLTASASNYGSVDARWFWSRADGSPAAATLATQAGEEWLVRLTNQAIATLSTAADLEAFLDPAGLGLQVLAGLGLPGLVLLGTAGEGIDVAAHLAEHAGVAYFEPNESLATDFSLPNDPRFGELYGLHNTGQSAGLADADIDAPEAWQLTTGSRNVVVSVIDTGIDMGHRDLYRNIWINQAEIPPAIRSQVVDVDSDGRITFVDLNHPANSSLVADRNGNGYIDALDLLRDPRWANGQDTDGNSFVDDLVGWNFVSNTNNPSDDNRHGTHVAGTIGATGNDGVGVVGVSWEVSMMGIKFLSGSGSGSTANAIKSVNYATMTRLRGDEGVRVTNNSWGGGAYSQSLKDAIDAGGAANILFVAAAGNSQTDLNRSPHYPAAYTSPAIVAVAATDRRDALAGFSNFGATRVHLGAPGSGILSAVPGGGYAVLNGTSMAAPHVAGAAALALAANPNLSLAELKQAILATTDPVPALAGRTLTGGRLNAARLVEMVGVPDAQIELTGRTVPENSPPGTLVGTFSATARSDNGYAFSLVPGAADNAAFAIEGQTLRTAESFDFETRSRYTVRVRATDGAGRASEQSFTIEVLDINEPPALVTLGNAVTAISEGADTSRPVLMGEIVISDDALGTNIVSLAGPDATAFELLDGSLYLRANVMLDRDLKPAYAVIISVQDPTLEGSEPVQFTHVLQVTPAVTSWSYGFRHINDSAADRHLVESFGMRKYSEWQSTPITYWGPTANGVEGRLIYRFDFPQPAVAARMRISLPSWDYTRPPDGNSSGRGRGAWALEVSKDGELWVAVRNNLEPRNWGDKWNMDGPLPAAVLGGQSLFVRMRFLVENSPNSSYTNAQFGRSTAAATSDVFQISASLAVNRRPTDILLLLRDGGIPEDTPVGTVVGGLISVDPDPDDTFTYALVSGDGSTDNAAFQIVGQTLVTAAGFDFETKDTLSVRIRSTDAGGRWVEQTFTLPVADVNEPPTAVLLENVVTALPEDTDTSAPVKLADIVVVDDALGTNQITLTGPGAELFVVTEGSLYLRAGAPLDHALMPELAILIVVSDPDLLDAEPVTAAFTLVVDKADPPAKLIVLSKSEVDENQPVGTPIGTFSRLEERSELTPLHLFYSPQNGQMQLANLTTELLAVQSVTITSPGRKLNGGEALMPDAPFRTTNHDDFAPFGLYSEIFFANFGTAALTLEPGAVWDFGFVADVGLDREALDEHFETDPEVDDGAGDRSGRFLYTLLDTDTIAARVRGRITNTASDYTFVLVAGAGDADNQLFTIDGQTLLTAAEIDYETRDTYSIRIRSTGPSALTVEEILTITVRDVNEAPTAIQLIDAVIGLPENLDTNLPIPLGTIVVVDDALGTNVVTLHGDDAGLFMIEGVTLFLKAGVVLDFETQASYSLTLRVGDPSLPNPPVVTDYVLTIIDVNEPPTAVGLVDVIDSLPEQLFGPAGERVQLANIMITDDALGRNEITLVGPDAAAFEVIGTRLYLRAGVELDYETQNAYDVMVSVADPSIDGSEPVMLAYRLHVLDLNESPTAILLTNRLLTLPESADTSERIRVADITVVDDALGSNTISVSGRDAALFEVVGSGLYLRAGVTLDYGIKDRFQVAVHVTDETAVDRLAETPLTLAYEASTGQMRLVNTAAKPLAIQSVGIVSPLRVLSGSAAEVPEAVFTVLNTSERGLFGEHSEIFFANVGAAVLSLGSGGTWGLGPVALSGLTAAGLQVVFATDPEADPQLEVGQGHFLYSLLDTDPAQLVRGAIVTEVQAGFTLGIVNVPEHSGREYVEVAAGETVIDTIHRVGQRQLIKRGEGTLVLAGANGHAGGTRVEGGVIVAQDSAAFGQGTLELLAGTLAVVDVGTGRINLGGLVLEPAARIDVGFGGLRLAAQAVDPSILRQWLINGRGRGDWQGAGIGSTQVAGQRSRAVGYRSFADGSATIAWAAMGDANLDGRVNSTDINMILGAGRFGRTGAVAGWSEGDFNYDGRVNSQDLNLLMAAGLLHGPSYHPRAGSPRGLSVLALSQSDLGSDFSVNLEKEQCMVTVVTSSARD